MKFYFDFFEDDTFFGTPNVNVKITYKIYFQSKSTYTPLFLLKSKSFGDVPNTELKLTLNVELNDTSFLNQALKSNSFKII
jgi:hypothetical protein